MTTVPTAVATIGDRVVIDGQAGIVTRVQLLEGLRIVSAGSERVESDGEGSLLIDVLEVPNV